MMSAFDSSVGGKKEEGITKLDTERHSGQDRLTA